MDVCSRLYQPSPVGCTTNPAVQVAATSGTRAPFEPETTTGFVWAPFLGSVSMLKAVVFGPNSSLTFGARMSRDFVARTRSICTGSHTRPYFHVVVLTS